MHSPVSGRERVFEHAANQLGTPLAILRLNYAIDLRYGILLDIAEKVYYEKPVDVTMGAANVIWQETQTQLYCALSCTAKAHRCFLTSQVRKSFRFAGLPHDSVKIFGKAPAFEGMEAETALLSNATRCHQLFGYPRISLEQMVQWMAHWVEIGGVTLGKPTKFEVRDGKF